MALCGAYGVAHAQQCSFNGGTITFSTTSSCTISNSGSGVTINSPATFSGWMNFTGFNTNLRINSGASFFSNPNVFGNPSFSGVTAHGGSWSLVNAGSITGNSSNWDLVGIRDPGTFSITNTGVIRNTSSDSSGSAIESDDSRAILTIDNSGTISAVPADAINLFGATTITNQSAGLIQSSQAVAIDSVDDLDITNFGQIKTLSGSQFAIRATS